MTIAGMAILSFGDLAEATDSFTGDMLALSGAAAVSGYLLIGRYVRQRLEAFTYVVTVYLVAAVTLAIVAVASGTPVFGYALREYLIFLGIAFFCTLLGHTLFNWALRHLKTAFVSMAVLTEPVYATVLAIIIFSEVPATTTFVGGAVVLLGVLLFVREENTMEKHNIFDEKAKNWDENPMQRARSEAVAQAIRRIVPLSPSTRVLDYGAGTGLVALNLAPDVGSVLAVDTSDGMLSELERKATERGLELVTPKNHNLEAEPLSEGPFDLIYSVMTLHHVKNVSVVLDRFAELLAPGGTLAIAELVTEDGSFHGHEHKVHHQGFDQDHLASELEKRGLCSASYERVFVIERDGKSFPVFLLTAKKN